MNSKRKMSNVCELIPILVRVDDTNTVATDISVYKKEFKIGRGLDNDHVIPHTLISRRHCILKCDDKNIWTITDLSSSCTFVNDILLEYGTARVIQPGDVVQFSPFVKFKYTFTFGNDDKFKSKRLRLSEFVADSLVEQKAFITSQESKKEEVEHKLEIKRKKQVELELELEQLVKNQYLSSDEDDDLNEKIFTLKRNVNAGNMEVLQLENLRHELSESLEKIKLQFEMQLNNKNLQIQEALRLNNQESSTSEASMRNQIEVWKVQWRGLLENLIQEKAVQAQLEKEKVLLKEKLKEMEETLKEKTAKSTDLVGETSKNNLVDVIEIVDDKKIAPQAQVLDIIDLTLDSPARTEVPNCTKDNIFEKVGNIMDEQLTCSICSELFVKATTLNCTHTFCEYCINAWAKKKRDCPVCRCIITTMNQSLVLDNFIDKMLETLPSKYKTRRTEIIKERAVIGKTAKPAKFRSKRLRDRF